MIVSVTAPVQCNGAFSSSPGVFSVTLYAHDAPNPSGTSSSTDGSPVCSVAESAGRGRGVGVGATVGSGVGEAVATIATTSAVSEVSAGSSVGSVWQAARRHAERKQGDEDAASLHGHGGSGDETRVSET